jgi:hypothetical protein
MNASTAAQTIINLAFAIAIWFAVPIVLPVAATLGWTLIIINSLFSLGIVLGIFSAYAKLAE